MSLNHKHADKCSKTEKKMIKMTLKRQLKCCIYYNFSWKASQ